MGKALSSELSCTHTFICFLTQIVWNHQTFSEACIYENVFFFVFIFHESYSLTNGGYYEESDIDFFIKFWICIVWKGLERLEI